MVLTVGNYLDVAIRLADEGVPMAAISRATRIPSDELRLHLVEAKEAGTLVDLPRSDWPPGFPRDSRAHELSRLATLNPATTKLLVRQLFSLAPMEVELFLVLMQNAFLAKNRVGMSPRTLDVHLCRIRGRLRPHDIRVQTIWGLGYQLSPADRKKALDRIFSSSPTPAVEQPRT